MKKFVGKKYQVEQMSVDVQFFILLTKTIEYQTPHPPLLIPRLQVPKFVFINLHHITFTVFQLLILFPFLNTEMKMKMKDRQIRQFCLIQIVRGRGFLQYRLWGGGFHPSIQIVGGFPMILPLELRQWKMILVSSPSFQGLLIEKKLDLYLKWLGSKGGF